jgi:ankyrin repeat protein
MNEELADALRTGDTATALALIVQMQAAGASLNVAAPNGITPTHLAAEHGHSEMIAALFAADPELAVNALNDEGWTPAHLAAQRGHAGTITALHAAGADLNATGPDGWAPAHLAAQYDRAGTITALQGAGANLNAADLHGWSPAHLAVEFVSEAAITALHEAGANLDAAGPNERTPAHMAAQDDHAGMISALHAAGANLNAIGPEGKTPAHLAAEHGCGEAITALHEAGADLNARDERGQTPIDLAGIHEHELVFNALFVYNQSRLMTAVVDALGDSADTSARNLAGDLKCPVMLEAYTTHGETRPVRLPDGAVNAATGRPVPGSVLSALAARNCMRPDLDGDLGRPPPTDPLNRNRFTEADAETYLASDAFLLGDTVRVALVGAVWEACERTDKTPAAIAAAATTAAAAVVAPAVPVAAPASAAGAAVPQYQAILDASAARSAPGPHARTTGPRRGQGGPAM